MKITDLALIEVAGEFAVEAQQSEERRVDPLDLYPEFGEAEWRPSRRRPGERVEHRDVYLEVRTDEGVTGVFGPVDGAHAMLLRRELREFVIGRSEEHTS